MDVGIILVKILAHNVTKYSHGVHYTHSMYLIRSRRKKYEHSELKKAKKHFSFYSIYGKIYGDIIAK